MAQADPHDRHVLAVSGSQTLSAMAATQAALLDALSVRDEVVVDCSDVAEADVSFVQLLIAGRRHARAAGKDLALSQPPGGALLQALARGGFLAAAGASPTEEQSLWRQAEGGA